MPSRMIRPLATGTKPDIALKKVVLPAPFGPIRPRISPAAICIDAPWTAFNPPKLTLSSSTRKVGSISRHPPWSDLVWPNRIYGRRTPRRQRGEHGCSNHAADEIPETSDQHHGELKNELNQPKTIWNDKPEGKCKEAAADPGIKRAERKGQRLDP